MSVESVPIPFLGALLNPIPPSTHTKRTSDAHAPAPLNESGSVLLARQAPDPARLLPPPALAARLRGAGLREMERTADVRRSYVQDGYRPRPGLQWSVSAPGARVTAAQLQHRVPCWGYVFDEELPAAGDEAAWRAVRERWALTAKRQQDARSGSGSSGGGARGSSSHSSDAAELAALAAAMPRPAPRRVIILGDTMDSAALAPAALGADLLSHEATFARGAEHKALRAQHSTAWMAGQFARAVGARALVLTHFSARYRAGSGGGTNGTGTGSDDDDDGGHGYGGAARGRGYGGAGRGGARFGGRGGRGGRGGGDQADEQETDSQTLRALIAEAADEFGSDAVSGVCSWGWVKWEKGRATLVLLPALPSKVPPLFPTHNATPSCPPSSPSPPPGAHRQGLFHGARRDAPRGRRRRGGRQVWARKRSSGSCRLERAAQAEQRRHRRLMMHLWVVCSHIS